MKDRLIMALRDRKVVAVIFAAVVGGLGLSLSPALRDALWALWAAALGGSN